MWRGIRVAILMLAFLGVVAWAWLNMHGVPGFVADRVIRRLEAKGIFAQFETLRLQGWREWRATKIRIRTANTAGGFELVANYALLHLDRRLNPSWLRIDGGRLAWAQTNAPADELILDHSRTEVHAVAPNRFVAVHSSTFKGVQLNIKANVANPAAFRTWRKEPKAPGAPADFTRLREVLAQLAIQQPARIDLKLAIDAERPDSFQSTLNASAAAVNLGSDVIDDLALRLEGTFEAGHVDLTAQRVSIAQSNATNFVTTVRWTGVATNRELASVELRAGAREVRLPWGAANELAAEVSAKRLGAGETNWSASVKLDAHSAWSRYGSATAARAIVSASVPKAALFHLPDLATWRAEAVQPDSRWGKAASAQLSGMLARNREFLGTNTPADWGWWTQLAPYSAEFQGRVAVVRSPKLAIEEVDVAARWSAPTLDVSRIHAQLYDGGIDLRGQLDVGSRQAKVDGEFNFDVHRAAPLLTTNAQRWLRQFAWTTPPAVRAKATATLPSWTNSQPNWRREVLPTVAASGSVKGTDGAYRRVPISSVRSQFTLRGTRWTLSDMEITRPEGVAHCEYSSDMATREFHWKVAGEIDPLCVMPLLKPPEQRALDYFRFTQPPYAEGDIWGRYGAPEETGFIANVRAKNFTFRAEQCDMVTGGVEFTNRFFNFTDFVFQRDGRKIIVPTAGYDVRKHLLHVTNATSTVDPGVVTRVIGPKTHAALQPYHFGTPPAVRANGTIGTRRDADSDVLFEVAGADFRWWKLQTPHISGNVFWKGDDLVVTNVNASFYGGRLDWWGVFDMRQPRQTRMQFQADVADANFKTLIADLVPTTNRFEGLLNGRLVVTNAVSTNVTTWQGFGNVSLRNGYLWDVPIFGFFSPFLETLAPGLGSSKVSAGAASFALIDGVVHTRDLEVRSPAMRLDYNGTVALDGKVDARVEAEILRDVWGVGRIFSLALLPVSKALVYKVTGTIGKPVTEPLYIPKLFLKPWHPFKALLAPKSTEPKKKRPPRAR